MTFPSRFRLLPDRDVTVALFFTVLTSMSLSAAVFVFLLDSKLTEVSNQHGRVLGKANQILNGKLGDIQTSTILINNHAIDLLRVNNSKAADVFAQIGENHTTI